MSANIDWFSRKVIGCDGTTANIGNPGKVIKWLEKNVKYKGLSECRRIASAAFILYFGTNNFWLVRLSGIIGKA